MSAIDPTKFVRRCITGCLLAGLSTALAHAGVADLKAADSLRAKYAELRSRLGSNQFQKPLHLESSESPDGVAGDIHALVDHPLSTAAAALTSPGDWCEILILHINTKYCRASTDGHGSVLHVSIGKKFDQPLDQAYRVNFAYRVVAQSSDYLQIRLNSDQGPLSTRDTASCSRRFRWMAAGLSCTFRIPMLSVWPEGWRCRSISAPRGGARSDSPSP